MTLLYFKLALAGIGGGCIMIASGLDMHWQGAVAILVGVGALGLGIRELRATDPTTIAAHARDPDGPYTAEDFLSPNIVPPAGAISIHRLPDQVDAAPDGSGFVVGYGDYLSPILVTDDPWKLTRGQQLALALRASPGADAADPKSVGHENVSGLLEDDFVRYECRLRVTPANVLALRATRFAWTDAAERLAMPVASPAEAVEAVRRTMTDLARRDVGQFRELMERLSDKTHAEPGAAADGGGR